MKKRLLVIITMAVVMLVGATIAASADSTPVLNVWTGTQYKDVTKESVAGCFYDSSTHTLTISNLNIVRSTVIKEWSDTCILAENFDSLTINVATDSNLTCLESSAMTFVDCKNVTFTGKGKLTIVGQEGIVFWTFSGEMLEDQETFFNGANIEICAEYYPILYPVNCYFNGDCNVVIKHNNNVTENYVIGVFTLGTVSFNLSKGGKVLLEGGDVEPIAAPNGIKMGSNSKITSPSGAKITYMGEDECEGYTITDADGNIPNEIVVEYAESGSSASVNTADNAPMIIFAAMAMLVILGTTTVLLKKQK